LYGIEETRPDEFVVLVEETTEGTTYEVTIDGDDGKAVRVTAS
jgi:hypothetical protein